MKKSSKHKLKYEVDEIAGEVLADDEEVSDEESSTEQVTNLKPEFSTTASVITTDERFANTSQSEIPRRTGRTQIVRVDASSINENTQRKPSSKGTGAVQNSLTAEITETEDYLIITLSASHRRELPKIKSSSKSFVSDSSKRKVPSSKVKTSGLASYSTSRVEKRPKCFSPKDSSLVSQRSSKVAEEPKMSKVSSESSKVPDKFYDCASKASRISSRTSNEFYDCESVDTDILKEPSTEINKKSEPYKAKTPIVLHDASKATTKYPDDEFFNEFRNHTAPSKWNNPVRRNIYRLYYDPYRHLRKTNYVKNISRKIPKQFSTFLLRVLKSEKVHRKTDVTLKTERLPAYPSTRIPTSLAKKEREPLEQLSLINSPSVTDPIDPILKSGTAEPPITFSTSNFSAADSPYPLTSTRTDPFETTSTDEINPVQIHSTSTTETEHFDSISMNPIKFRKKLQKLSHSKSNVKSPGAQRNEKGSTYETGAIPKTQTELGKGDEANAVTDIRSDFSAELLKGEEVLLRTVPQTKSILKSKALTREGAVPKGGYITKHVSKDNAEIKGGNGTQGGDVINVGEVSKGEASKAKSFTQAGVKTKAVAISTEEKTTDRIAKKFSSMSKRDIPSETGVIPKTKTGVIPKTKTGVIPKSKTGAIPKSKTGAIPKLKTEAIPKSKTGALPKLKTEAISKSETSATRTVAVLPLPQFCQEGSKPKTSPKAKSGTSVEKGQFRDIPVIAYVRRPKKNPTKTILDYYRPKEDGWIRGYWRKFKYYKRIESERQQNLLEKIVCALDQIDSAMHAARNHHNYIEKLRLETCDSKESLKYHNSKMKWSMSRLMLKTKIIVDFLENFKCDIVLYTLETSASNNITSKRLYKLLTFLCGKKERKQRSEGKLSPVEEEVEIKLTM